MNEISRIHDLAAYLKKAAASFSQRDYEWLRRTLCAKYEQQCMEARIAGHPRWSIVEGNAACMLYLYRNWVFSQSMRENALRLMALADDIFENYEDHEDKDLPANAIAETLKIADATYHFSNRFLTEHHLFVFLFPVRHRREDAFCRRLQMSDGCMAADIYMLIPHIDRKATLQSVFLHELGHCINIALTGDPQITPKDFILCTALLGIDSSACNMPEFFAHCFAMSVLIEPNLLKADPFNAIPQKHKRLFRAYFEHKLNLY